MANLMYINFPLT